MITLFDYQADNGMVPDFISYNKKYNNWRDAKPPVAAWGAMNVYKATGDKKFLEQCSTSSISSISGGMPSATTITTASANTVPPTALSLLPVGKAAWTTAYALTMRDAEKQREAWSMNQENICLNSFLYVDKTILAEMATLPEQARTGGTA